jgi:hypothetical protein
VRPADVLAGLLDRLRSRDARLLLQLSQCPRVVPGEGRDRVPSLLGHVGQTAALPEEKRDKRPAQAIRPQVAGDPGSDGGRAPDAVAPVRPVLSRPGAT